ncbi:S-layer homology domain-containing protein [Solibacillus silvestris]|uniref:S-layer homology domain-containing protein n=1 Tax=Solibacillus silvestris TaxID=76853 RepID=UPI003F82240E
MRLLSLIGTLVLALILVNGSPVNAAAATYSDVPETHSNYEDIMYLLERNIVDAGNTYGINDIVTREEVAVMIVKSIGLNGKQRPTKFSDVEESNPNSGYIQSAVEAGIINGYDDGTFKPDLKISRGHMATFISRAFELPSGTKTFKDVSKGNTAYKAVQQLAAAGIATGYEDGTFKPSNSLTRGHISAFLARTLQYNEITKFNVEEFLHKVNLTESLEEQLKLLNSQNEKVKAILQKEQTALNELLVRKKEIEKDIASIREKLNPIQSKVTEYHATISASNKEIQEYRAKNKTLYYGTTNQKEQYLKTLNILQQEYAAVQKEKTKLIAERDELNNTYNSLKEGLNQTKINITNKQKLVNTQSGIVNKLKTAEKGVDTRLAAIEQQKQNELNNSNPTEKPSIPTTTIPEDQTNNTNMPTENLPVDPVQPYEVNLEYLTADEKELARLINEYRTSLGLEPLTISKSLTRVARTHVNDSNAYSPKDGIDERGVACNGHSWSNNGNWTPVCYTSDHQYAKFMWDKPRELTEYTGNGYEISIYYTGKLTPLKALNGWQGSPAHNSVIIGEGFWGSLTTMGVGINEKYSHVWFGVEQDPALTIE